MANLKTKCDIADLGSQKTRVWKSLVLSNGDILFTGLKDIWAVFIQDSSKWAASGWTAGSGTTAGQVTFNLSAPTTGRVVVYGR